MNVQFISDNGEIVSATLSSCGLFCDATCNGIQVDKDAIPGASLYSGECTFFGIDLIEYKNFMQAHPACQVAAKELKK